MVIPISLFANIGSEYMSFHNFSFDFVKIIKHIWFYIKSSQQYYVDTNLGIPQDTFLVLRYFYFLYMPFVFNFLIYLLFILY